MDSTIKNNTASSGSQGGGGVYVGDGTLSVSRSTFSGNTTTSAGGAIRLAFGSQAPTGSIVNSTITGNTASSGAGLNDGGGQVKISYSTLTGNTATGVGGSAIDTNGFQTDRLKANILQNPAASKECSIAQTTVDGFNFIRDASCQSSTANSNHPSTAISVGALANNGGPTQTQALASGSAAIDAAGSAPCTDLSGATLSLDQRSVARPQGSACDAGAFEFVPAPQNSVLPSISGTPAVGQTLTCSPGTWSGSATFTYQWRRDGTDISGTTSSTYNVASADAGHTLVCHVTATNSGGSNSADSSGVAIPAGSSGGGGSGGGSGGGGGGGGGGTGGGGGGGGTPSVQFTGSPKSTGNGVSFTLQCSAPAGQSCQTTDTLTSTETLKNGKPVAVSAKKAKKRKVVVGRASPTIPAGATKRITITLNALGQKLLKRFHRLPVTLTVSLNKTTR